MPEEAAPSKNIPGQPLDAIRCECGTTVNVESFPALSLVACPKCNSKFPKTVKLGNFLLLSRLGSGAMGDVFEAKDRTLGRHVAIKVIGGKATVSDKTIRDFVAEARNLAQLNHRNVVQIHSIGVEDQHPYLVMELVGAGRLDQYIVRDTPGDERTVLTFGIDAARGLEAAANRGLIHGDVKPANILINDEGLAKIVDFGLARFAETQIEGKVYGTPFYIAPELLDGKAADFRSDMYSLACSLFHVLAGRPPFRAKKVKEIVKLRLIEPAPDVRTFAPNVSEYTAYFFNRVLAKNPDDRYVDYDEMVQDMTYALQLLDAGMAHSPGPLPPPPGTANNAYADSAADLSELDAAVSHSEREALTSRGHAHRRTKSGRKRGRGSGRRSLRDTQALSASQTHIDGLSNPEGGSKGRGVIIAVAAIMIAAGVTLGVVLLGGSGGKDGGKDGEKDGGPVAATMNFTDSFESTQLDAAWKNEGIGGHLPGGGVLRLTDSGKDPQQDATIERIFGQGDYVIDIKIKALQWAGRGEKFRFEFKHDNNRGLDVTVWNDQSECRMECEAIGASTSKVASITKFEKPPTTMNLSVRWSGETQRWRVSYGINGDPPKTELEGINQIEPAETDKTRRLRITADQFGTNGVTSMDIDAIAVQSP